MSDTISSKPLFARLKDRGDLAAFAEKIKSSVQRVSNWRDRGVPKAAVMEVAAALGMSAEDYYALASKGESGNLLVYGDRQNNIPRSDAEKLVEIIRLFLDTDSEVREEILAGAQSLAEKSGTASRRSNNTSRNKRR